MSTTTGVVEVTCLMCRQTHTILVPVAGYKKWAAGLARIQDAMPGLSEDDRELLISNICGKCFDKAFS